MKIVIDIPEVFYEALKKTDEIVSGQRSGKTLMSVIYNAVAQGTPLPKEQEPILDKIKRDVFNACCDNYHMPVHKLDCDEVFDIIDKYKAESEDKE